MDDVVQRNFIGYITFDTNNGRRVISEGNGFSGDFMLFINHADGTITVDQQYRGAFMERELDETIPPKAREYTVSFADLSRMERGSQGDRGYIKPDPLSDGSPPESVHQRMERGVPVE